MSIKKAEIDYPHKCGQATTNRQFNCENSEWSMRVHWTLQFVRYLLTIACEEQMQLSIVTIMTSAVPASSYFMSQTAKILSVYGGDHK